MYCDMSASKDQTNHIKYQGLFFHKSKKIIAKFKMLSPVIVTGAWRGIYMNIYILYSCLLTISEFLLVLCTRVNSNEIKMHDEIFLYLPFKKNCLYIFLSSNHYLRSPNSNITI